VLIEEAPQPSAAEEFPDDIGDDEATPETPREPWSVLPLSERSAPGLVALAQHYSSWLEANPGASIADVCFTAGAGRSHFEHRAALVANSVDEARMLLDDLVAVAWAQQGLGTWDLGLMLALNHNDKVLGLSASGGWGPVGLRAEGTLTAPDPEAGAPAINALRAIFGEAPLPADRDPFTRALVGADWRPGPRTSLSGELYRQGMGAAAADDYLAEATDPRVSRGEQWLLGRVYGAVALQQELRPTLQSSLSLISNLRDPSALLGLGLGWSVADNAEVALGGYAGLGARPGEAPPLPAQVAGPAAAAEAAGLISAADLAALRQAWRTSHTPTESELGLSPTTLYAQVRTYF
jgi:hypothetical protein